MHVDPEILLVDEVLAVGDEPFQRKCMERIKQFQREGRTILLVTHGLDVVRQLCDRVIMLEKGTVVVDGSPLDALRAFRDLYQQDVVAIDAFGTQRIAVEAVRVTDGKGHEKGRFDSGEALGIELDVVANEPTDDWAVGVAIYNHLDLMVYGINTVLLGQTLPAISGRHQVRIDFDDIPMVEGQYMVTVALHNVSETEQYHRLERTASFRVFNPTNEVGVLHMNTHVSVSN